MRLFELVLHLFHPRRSNNHRPKILHPDLILGIFAVMTVGLVGLSQLPHLVKGMGDVLGYSSSITIDQVLAQTNAKRAEVGLSALRLDPTLSSAALAKGQDMLNQQYWSHQSPSGKQPWDFIKDSGYRFSVAGENLARDFSTTPDLIQAWMNSPTHKANIIHPRYTDIGLAVIDGQLDGLETTLVVQMFGRPLVGQAELTPAAQNTVVGFNLTEPSPQPSPALDDSAPVLTLTTTPRAGVLASNLTFAGRLGGQQPYSPLTVAKSAVISLMILIGLVLIYDHCAIGHRRSWRQVGKTPAHLLFIAVALFFAILTQSGRLG